MYFIQGQNNKSLHLTLAFTLLVPNKACMYYLKLLISINNLTLEVLMFWTTKTAVSKIFMTNMTSVAVISKQYYIFVAFCVTDYILILKKWGEKNENTVTFQKRAAL